MLRVRRLVRILILQKSAYFSPGAAEQAFDMISAPPLSGPGETQHAKWLGN
jgi:hypothetical protein